MDRVFIRRFQHDRSPADNGDIVSARRRGSAPTFRRFLMPGPEIAAPGSAPAPSYRHPTWNPETSRAGVSDFTFAVKGWIGHDGRRSPASTGRSLKTMALNLRWLAGAGGRGGSERDRPNRADHARSLGKHRIEASIRYDDESLFMALDIAAAEQGSTVRRWRPGSSSWSRWDWPIARRRVQGHGNHPDQRLHR